MESNAKSILNYANILDNFKMFLEFYIQAKYTLKW